MRATITILSRATSALTMLLDRFGGWFVLPMVSAIVLMDVFLRYVLNDPTIWGLEFSQWFLLLVFVTAVAECTRRHGHIRMELLYSVMPAWAQRIVNVVYSLLSIWVLWLLLIAEWEEMIYSIELDRITEYLLLPYWIQHAALLFMAAIMIVFFALRALGILAGKDPFPEDDPETMKLED